MLRSGWCAHVPLLIQSDQLVVVEKGLLAMRALSGTCNFSAAWTRLQALTRQLEQSGRDQGSDEYAENLLEHCRALISDIRKHNHNIDL